MASILIIDDDVDVGNTVVAMLAGTGHEVMFESDPWRIKKMLSENSFDLIISDIFMPSFDGIEVVLTANKINPETKVLIMTGGSSNFPSGSQSLSDLAESSELLGARGVIMKPFRRQDLIDAVTKLLTATVN